MTRFLTCVLLSFFIFTSGQTARADSTKQALFVLGIQMGGAEGVADEFVGDPTRDHPGAIALIKRNLSDSIPVAEALKLSPAGLKSLLADVDRVTFQEMATRLADLRLAAQAEAAKNINPGAGAFFAMGVHQS